MTVMRRFSAGLIRHAVSTLPVDRRPWGTAMLAEFDEIPGDVEALRWTWGVVRTAGRLRREAISAATRVPTGARWTLGAILLAPTAGALTLLIWEAALATRPGENNYHGLGVIVAVVFGLPAALVVAAIWCLLAVWWRRRAGTPPGRFTYRAAVVAEGLTVAAIGALWIGSFALTFSTGIDGMGPVETVLIVTANTAMASLGWVIVLGLTDVLRRLLRTRTTPRPVPA